MIGRTGLLLLLCLALTNLSNCGVRGDPVPPEPAREPAPPLG